MVTLAYTKVLTIVFCLYIMHTVIIFHVAQRMTIIKTFYTYLNGNVKAVVFESVWMFADAATEDSWAIVAFKKREHVVLTARAS